MRSCPIRCEITSVCVGSIYVLFNFGDEDITIDMSYVLGDYFEDFIEMIYYFHPENYDEYYQSVYCDDTELFVIGSVSFDEEGSSVDFSLKRKKSEESIDFPVDVTIEIHRSEDKKYSYSIYFSDLCYAITDAYTKAIKKYGLYGYAKGSYGDYTKISQVLFLKSIAIKDLGYLNIEYDRFERFSMNTNILNEIELLFFDLQSKRSPLNYLKKFLRKTILKIWFLLH